MNYCLDEMTLTMNKEGRKQESCHDDEVWLSATRSALVPRVDWSSPDPLPAPVLYLQHPYRNTHLRREVDLGHRGGHRSITVVEHTQAPQDPGAGAKFHFASNHAYGTLQKHGHQ